MLRVISDVTRKASVRLSCHKVPVLARNMDRLNPGIFKWFVDTLRDEVHGSFVSLYTT